MNTQSIDARYNKDFKDIPLKPGDFCYDINFTHIYFILPGCKHPDSIPIRKGGHTKELWGWDGNIEQPTLEPSIHDIGHWHGYLKAGKFESC